jgi:hypothetical protein
MPEPGWQEVHRAVSHGEARQLRRDDPGVQPGRYASTVVPIALGYTVAHYVSLLPLAGQNTWILASNPFGVAGVDIFGTDGTVVLRAAPRRPASDQLPLVIVMVLFTVGGLGLLFGF